LTNQALSVTRSADCSDSVAAAITAKAANGVAQANARLASAPAAVSNKKRAGAT
jgi:hypothetical protein